MIIFSLLLLTLTVTPNYPLCADDTYNFEGKIALVTGGAQGVGFAIILALLDNGVENVALVDYNVEKGREAEKILNEAFGSGRVIFVPADVANLEQFDNAFRVTLQHWNNLDIVVNNAGVNSETNWKRIVNINMVGTLHGTMLGFQYISQHRRGRGGVIMNIASIYGIDPSFIAPVYTASKHFSVAFGRALGHRVYSDYNEIRIVTLCPGVTNTSFTSERAVQNAVSNAFVPDLKLTASNLFKTVTYQSVSSVGKGAVFVIKVGTHGSVWVAEDDEKPYEINFPGRIVA